MTLARRFLLAAALTFILIVGEEAIAQFVQVGTKLVGTGGVGTSEQGFSAAISSDGNTAIVGGPRDSSDYGAAWVYTRSGNVWSQQGGKLIVADALGCAQQGCSVAISGDGNTAIVGGGLDNLYVGAAWIFTRSGGVWSKTTKLVGTDAIGNMPIQGTVAISADGNTAIVGGPGDNGNMGAAWIFVRGGNLWSQQAKLVGTGATNIAWQGYAVALSADGNTAVVGGPWDSSYTGASWIFTRSGSTWSQQARLVGTGVWYAAQQGTSVALSADGNTVLVGGPSDSSAIGAVWVFTRTAGVWSQQGNKLTVAGSPNIFVGLGSSVSLSSDGNTALLGGCTDSSSAGAAWIFTRSGGVWSRLGSKLAGTGLVGAARVGSSVSLSGDGTTAIIGGPQDNLRTGAAWIFMQGSTSVQGLPGEVPLQITLEQNFPNPFNPVTTIRYAIAGKGQEPIGNKRVRLAVYDLLGHEVAVLVNDMRPAGEYEARFDGAGLSSGVYFYRVQAGDPLLRSGQGCVQTRRLLLLK